MGGIFDRVSQQVGQCPGQQLGRRDNLHPRRHGNDDVRCRHGFPFHRGSNDTEQVGFFLQPGYYIHGLSLEQKWDFTPLAKQGDVVVAGDTLRAREAFSRIGSDQSDPAAQSRAQYHLGLLDFMGGEFEEAEDRLKAVALKSPRASFTNDALDLAILIAEENFGGAPDEDGLRMYGVMLYQRATHQRDEMQATLGEIAERELSPVRDRARLNLAEWHEAQGEEEEQDSQYSSPHRRLPSPRCAP